MRYAIFFTFDDETQETIQFLRKKLALRVPGVPRVEGKMGPHLTLAVFDSFDQSTVLEKFIDATADFRRFKIRLRDIGSFDGRWKVLFISPGSSKKLQFCCEHIHKVFCDVSTMVPHYRDPTEWKPHITLTKGIKGRVFEDAKAYAVKHWKPVTATVTRAGIINVQRPLEVLGERILS